MSDREPIHVLQQLGDEFALATRAAEQAAARRRRWRRPGGLPMVALVAALSITGVAAAATQLFGLAAPVSAPARRDVPRESRPLPSTVQMAGIDASDPDGLPSWDVRVSRSETGEVCTAVGQVQGGTFGMLGLDQKFRALPLGAADACGLAPSRDRLQVGARAAIGNATMSARTLVAGIAGPGITSISVDAGTKQAVPIGKDRAFLAVLKGLPDALHPIVNYRVAGERYDRSITIASDDVNVTRDSSYGTQDWEFHTAPIANFIYGGPISPNHPDKTTNLNQVCVQAHQAADPAMAGTDEGFREAQTPTTCWSRDHAPVVATIRRLVPSVTGGAHFYYGLNPARTVVQGIASPAVKTIGIPAGADHDGVLSIASAAHTDGSFMWVLDGKVDPRNVELDVTLKSGRQYTVGSTGHVIDLMSGKPYALPRDPAWQDVAALKAQTNGGSATKPVAGTDQISQTFEDPAGGPAWAVHTWLAKTDRTVDPTGPSGTQVCATFGPLVDGEVRQAVGKRAGTIAPQGLGQQCMPQRPKATSGRYAVEDFGGDFPTVYVDDPNSASPHVARIEMAALEPGITAATVQSNAYGPRVPMMVTPRGAALALLPASYGVPGAMLRIHFTFADGHTKTTGWADFSPHQRHAPPAAHAPDPGGGAGWGLQSAELRFPNLPGQPGQLIDGRLGQINPSTGSVFWSPGGGSFGGQAPRTPRNPVSFQSALFLDSASNQPGIAQIQRRIAPGRTVVYGYALPGTRTVTIRTPRDVRTVRPSRNGHMFLAVYDGRFTQGFITVTGDGPHIHGSATKPVTG